MQGKAIKKKNKTSLDNVVVLNSNKKERKQKSVVVGSNSGFKLEIEKLGVVRKKAVEKREKFESQYKKNMNKLDSGYKETLKTLDDCFTQIKAELEESYVHGINFYNKIVASLNFTEFKLKSDPQNKDNDLSEKRKKTKNLLFKQSPDQELFSQIHKRYDLLSFIQTNIETVFKKGLRDKENEKRILNGSPKRNPFESFLKKINSKKNFRELFGKTSSIQQKTSKSIYKSIEKQLSKQKNIFECRIKNINFNRNKKSL